MEGYFSAKWEQWTKKEIAPDITTLQPKFNPLLGFEHRTERVAPLTEEQMRLAHVPPHARDYCADKHIDLERCKIQEFPFLFKCKHEKHIYHQCLIDE